MGIFERLRALDRRMGIGRRDGESRRDFFERCARRSAYVPSELYWELVELHDRVAALEAAAGIQDMPSADAASR